MELDEPHMDIIFRRVLLEVCLMFKESTVVLKVLSNQQTLDGAEVPISSVIKKRVPSVFVFSRAGSLIKTKLQVVRCDRGTSQARDECIYCTRQSVLDEDVLSVRGLPDRAGGCLLCPAVKVNDQSTNENDQGLALEVPLLGYARPT